MNAKRRITHIAALITSVVMAVSITGCNNNVVENEIYVPIGTTTKVSYETAKATIMTIETEDKIPASLDFATSTTFVAPFEGKVKVCNVSKFQKVKAGDPIISLDTTDLDFQITELEIKIAASGDYIQREYYQIELDKLLAKRNAAVVVAPFDGIISQCAYAKEGTTIKEGAVMCVVAVPETIYVYNSEGAGKNLRFGMDVNLKINSVDYKGIVTAAPDTVPSTASKNASKYCAVTLNDEDVDRLINENDGISAADAGWATIYAITTRRVNVLAVPDSAIKKDGTKPFCTILQGDQKFDIPVETGASAGGYTEILSGINEGDTVILADKSK
ncbi:MAG: biotin/lipoyl-binding protein [Ruminococcaceae bacterium]|nr:biotin/lipoyl-binding protein [Oscillospiraceae bacterium]